MEELEIQVLLDRVAQGDFDLVLGGYSNVSPTAGDVFIYMYVTQFFGSGAPVDQVAESLGILTRSQLEALLVPEKLTQPLRPDA